MVQKYLTLVKKLNKVLKKTLSEQFSSISTFIHAPQ